MAEPYWPIPVVHSQSQPQRQPPGFLAPAPAGKRLRSDLDSTTDQPYVPQEANRGALHAIKDVASINASYERYLSATQMSSEMSARPPARVSGHPFDHPQGINSLDCEGRRDDVPLPPDASSTLYVEGFPANCTCREVAHIFRPFLGYREVRIVHKDTRQPGQDRVVLCFVDFASPAHAASALNALQGNHTAYGIMLVSVPFRKTKEWEKYAMRIVKCSHWQALDSVADIVESLDYLRPRVDHGFVCLCGSTYTDEGPRLSEGRDSEIRELRTSLGTFTRLTGAFALGLTLH